MDLQRIRAPLNPKCAFEVGLLQSKRWLTAPSKEWLFAVNAESRESRAEENKTEKPPLLPGHGRPLVKGTLIFRSEPVQQGEEAFLR